MFYKSFLFFLLSCLFAACGVPKDKARLSGELAQAGNAACYLYSEEGVVAGIDTIALENGKFTVEYPLKTPALITLLFPNFSKRQVVLVPGEEVTVSGDAGNLQQVEIKGTEENDALTEFRRTILAKPLTEQRMAAAKFISDHSSSLAALALYRDYFIDTETTDFASAGRLFKLLEKGFGSNATFQRLTASMRQQLSAAEGQPLPAFTAPTLYKSSVSSRQFLGRPLLLLCVATWNPDTYEYYRALRSLKRDERARFETLIVSFDIEPQTLRHTLERDGVQGTVVYDGKGVFSPLHSLLGVQVVPTAFLINAQGVIVKREVAAEQLAAALRRL